MDILFESNKAVASFRIQMFLVYCSNVVPQLAEHVSDTFPDNYPCYDINNLIQERHDYKSESYFCTELLSIAVSVGKGLKMPFITW
jgi:hypothetical protein